MLKYAGDQKYKPAARFATVSKGIRTGWSEVTIFSEENSIGVEDYAKRDYLLSSYLEDD